MGWVAATLLLLGTTVLVAAVWKKIAVDEVGEVRYKPIQSGVQGKVAYWLQENAPLRAPRPPARRRKKGRPDPESPAGRALAALIRQEMVEHQVAPEPAHERLLTRAPGPVSRAFLDGRMRRAVVLYALTRYSGPAPLFWPWLAFIASVRYGRRRLYLDTVTHAVREMRT